MLSIFSCFLALPIVLKIKYPYRGLKGPLLPFLQCPRTPLHASLVLHFCSGHQPHQLPSFSRVTEAAHTELPLPSSPGPTPLGYFLFLLNLFTYPPDQAERPSCTISHCSSSKGWLSCSLQFPDSMSPSWLQLLADCWINNMFGSEAADRRLD